MQFVGVGVELGVRRVRAAQAPAEVVRPDRVQITVEFVRQRPAFL
jgi:hypothetical protein